MIDLDNDAALNCDQLWKCLSKIINEAVRMTNHLLKLAGVEEKTYRHLTRDSLHLRNY